MTTFLRRIFIAALASVLPAIAADSSAKAGRQEDAARLQVFLDRANFGPGKIDGRYGDFTRKALALYRQSKGETPASTEAKSDATPDTNGLDLKSVDPVFISYTLTESDLKSVGELPDSVPAQAKQKWLPYQSAAEAIAEKFHTDVDFLAELNPGKTTTIKAGDALTVPNVEPFALDFVREIKPGADAANDAGDGSGDASKKAASEDKSDDSASTTSVKIDTKTNMLAVYDGDKLIAGYPVTIGSAQTESPIGDWKVRGIEKLPNFRYDKAMLEHGERSGDFHMLPPGPNNPVGVIWIALNKKGIGLHGTSDPDAIGRSASHGCVRLANWDIVRLAGLVKTGVPVSIH